MLLTESVNENVYTKSARGGEILSAHRNLCFNTNWFENITIYIVKEDQQGGVRLGKVRTLLPAR